MGASHVSTSPRNRRHSRDEQHPCQARASPSLVHILSDRSVAHVHVKIKQHDYPGAVLVSSLSITSCTLACRSKDPATWQAQPIIKVITDFSWSTGCSRAAVSIRIKISPCSAFVINLHADSDDMHDQKMPISHDLCTSTCKRSVQRCRLEIDASAGNMILTAFGFQR